MKIVLWIGFIAFSLHTQAQKEMVFVSGEWYITNFSTNDVELLKKDTLVLRRYAWADRKGEHIDSSFHTKDLWNVNFDEFGGFGIGWTDFLAAARGGEPPYYQEMYPCQNSIWKLKKKIITFYLDGISYPFRTYLNKERNEITLVKHE